MEWPAAHACAQSMCGSVQMDSFLFGHMNVMIFRQTRGELYTHTEKKTLSLMPCTADLIICKSSILRHLTYCHLTWHNCK